ncbi:hypothetical protein, partial [Psittacicella hinzii]
YNPRVVDEFLQTHLQYNNLLLTELGNLGISIAIALLAEKWNKDRFLGNKPNYWYNYGYCIGGPIAYGYSDWVYHNAIKLNIEKLFLVARDCYTFRPIIAKIGELRGKVLLDDYVYIPRSIYYRFAMLEQDEFTDLKQAQMTFNLLSQYALSDELNTAITKAKNDLTLANKVFAGYKQEIREIINNYADKYRSYITEKLQPISQEKVGVVDVTAGTYKAQKVIKRLLGQQVNVLGFYYANIYLLEFSIMPHLNYAREGLDRTKFLDKRNVMGPNWDMFEHTCSAPHLTATEVTFDQHNKAQVTFAHKDEVLQREVFFAEHCPLIYEGQQDFAQDVLERFGAYRVTMDFSCTFNNFVTFLKNPTAEDIKEFSKIECGLEQTATQCISLTVYSWRDVLKHPKRCLRNLRKIAWRTPLQKYAAALLPPIALKIRGIKHIALHICPFAQKRYGYIGLKIRNKFFYGIVFGSKYK